MYIDLGIGVAMVVDEATFMVFYMLFVSDLYGGFGWFGDFVSSQHEDYVSFFNLLVGKETPHIFSDFSDLDLRHRYGSFGRL